MNTETAKPLYQIQQDHYSLLRMIEDADGELTPDLEQALQITQEQLEIKAVNYGRVILALDQKEENIEAEIKRLKARKEKAAKSRELLMERLSGAMQQFGINKLESDLVSFSFRKSEAIEVYSPDVVPEQYYVTPPVKREISKTLIKEAMKEGCIVAGARLVTKNNLQVK